MTDTADVAVKASAADAAAKTPAKVAEDAPQRGGQKLADPVRYSNPTVTSQCGRFSALAWVYEDRTTELAVFNPKDPQEGWTVRLKHSEYHPLTFLPALLDDDGMESRFSRTPGSDGIQLDLKGGVYEGGRVIALTPVSKADAAAYSLAYILARAEQCEMEKMHRRVRAAVIGGLHRLRVAQ